MNNKKALLALLLASIIIIIGLTLAVFSDSIKLFNKFQTKIFNTYVTEEFVSPDDWLPGTTTTKHVYATNDGEVDAAVRVSYTEKWVSKNGNILPNKINGEDVAIINFSNNNDWTKEGAYYYYNKKLISGDSSSSFIESVKFNEIVPSDSNCDDGVEVINQATGETIGIKKSCSSSKNGYDDATYTLTIKVETVQYNLYKEIWNTNVEIN